jgi:DNA-binding SARP family transcriptional activator
MGHASFWRHGGDCAPGQSTRVSGFYVAAQPHSSSSLVVSSNRGYEADRSVIGMGAALTSAGQGEQVAAMCPTSRASRKPIHSGPRLALLSAFELRCNDRLVALPRPAQRLLAFLALQDRPVLRTRVAGTLWLESTQDHAFGSLRSALWQVRRPGHELVETTSSQLRLASHVAVDVHEAVAWARGVLGGSSELELSDNVGDLLPDWYDDWVLIDRERLRELRVRALECLCARLTTAGKFYQAVEAGLAAVEGEPLRESAHRSLITVHLAEGNQAEAIHQYRLYRELLHDQLGLEPSTLMEQLVRGLIVR